MGNFMQNRPKIKDSKFMSKDSVVTCTADGHGPEVLAFKLKSFLAS